MLLGHDVPPGGVSKQYEVSSGRDSSLTNDSESKVCFLIIFPLFILLRFSQITFIIPVPWVRVLMRILQNIFIYKMQASTCNMALAVFF